MGHRSMRTADRHASVITTAGGGIGMDAGTGSIATDTMAAGGIADQAFFYS